MKNQNTNTENEGVLGSVERQQLERLVLDRTAALETELADRKKAEKKLILSLDKITRNRQAILNLMEDLKAEMSERKQVEESLKAERNLLRTLIDNLPDTIYILDNEGRKIIANKADIKNIGFQTEAEVIGKSDLELFNGEIGTRGHNDNMSVIRTSSPIIDREEYFYDQNGMQRWLLTSKYPLYGGQGQLTGLLGTGHDITDRKLAQEELAMKNSEFRFLNRISIEISQLSAEEDIESFLTKQLMEYSGAIVGTFSEYDPRKKTLVTKHIETSRSIINQLIKLAGRKIVGLESPVSEENYKFILQEVAGIRKSLTEVTFGAIGEKADKTIKALLGVDRIYAMAYVVGGELFGTTILGFEEGKQAPRTDLLASFAHIAALSLQRRKAELNLKESEERYRMLIQNQGEGVGVVDLDENFVFVNPAAEEMFGVASGKLLNCNLLDFITEDSLPVVKSETEKRAQAEKSSYEVDINRANGQKRTILITATPQLAKDGKHIGTFGVFRDITDRKEAEEALKESEEKFRSIMENSADAIFITDQTGKYVYTNKAVTDMLGYSSEEMGGKTILDLARKNKIDQFFELFNTCLSEGRVFAEIELLKSNGNYISVDLNSVVLPGGLIYASCRDITQRKHAEQELIRAKEKAEESDRLKTAFIHNISHEIRTPMNAITGFSALLGEPDQSEETRNSFLQIIMESSDQLLKIVTDIIEISNIEAGTIKTAREDVNVNSSLRKVYQEYLQKAKLKNIDFKISTALPDSEAVIQSDKTKLEQILSSTVSNAFKFTSGGEIGLSYILRDGFLEFCISDTGIGIPLDLHERIFDRFYQVEYSLARQYEGTGLGLSISKAYVEMLGGKIWLQSEPARGSVFYFKIPYLKSVPHVINEVEYPRAEKINLNDEKTVLIAEDEENNFQLLVELLSPLNLNILHAGNGVKALEICQSGRKIDLVIMDIKMPVMDGYTATGEIKKIFPHLPVIAQTAYTFDSDREKALSAGCDDYISKPIRKDLLLGLMNKYLKF